MSNVDVLVDLQFGSTGKGMLAGYLSREMDYGAAISVNMPNAGHTAYCPDTDRKFVHKVLPSGIFGRNTTVLGIGPGSIFSIDRLAEEWANVLTLRDDLTLIVHEAAGILKPEHREAEQASLSRISSTMQGSAEALISKIRREPGAIVKDNAFALLEKVKGGVRIVNQREWMDIMTDKDILLEGSQGYSLGLSSGFYPYCTSRDCTPARVLADANLPVQWLGEVFGTCRVHPIRVGNTPDGFSGDWYPDQTELTFKQLGVAEELTTVTQRVRRIASFSDQQIMEAMSVARPDRVFLNFCNYDEDEAMAVERAINAAARWIGCGGVWWLGYGPRPTDMVEAGE